MKIPREGVFTCLSFFIIFSSLSINTASAQTVPTTLPAPIINWTLNGNTSGALKFSDTGTLQYSLTNIGVSSGTGKSGDTDGSIVLNGTSQYLSFTPYSPGASDLTFAARVNLSNTSGTKPIFWEEQNGATGRPRFLVYVENNKATCEIDNGTSQYISTITNISANTWYDIVCTRANGVYKIYLNGILDNTQTYSINNNTSISSTGYIGRRYNTYYSSGQFFFAGSIDEIKLYNSAIPSSNISQIFAVPSSKVIAWDLNGLGSGTTKYANSAGSNFPLTNFGGVSSSGKNNVVDGAIMLDGTSQYLSFSPYSPGAKDFTIATRIFPTMVTGTTKPIFWEEQNGATGRPRVLTYIEAGNAECEVDNGSSGAQWVLGATTITPNSWHDIVCSRSNGTYKIYVDGKLDGTQIFSSNSNTAVTSPGYLGRRYNTSYSSGQFFFPGSIDEVRVYESALNATEILNVFSSPTISAPANTAPTITLTGAATISLVQGTPFTDPGATAADTQDGNITSKIIVTGSVNTTTLGTTTLNYKVTDSGSLSAQTTRTIIITAAPAPTDRNYYAKIYNSDNKQTSYYIVDPVARKTNIIVQVPSGSVIIDYSSNPSFIYSIPYSQVPLNIPGQVASSSKSINYINPTGSESFTIPYQQNLTYSLPVDGQFFNTVGDSQFSRLIYRQGNIIKIIDFQSFGQIAVDEKLLFLGIQPGTQYIYYSDPLYWNKVNAISSFGIPLANVNGGSSPGAMIGVNGGPGWMAEMGKQYFSYKTGVDLNKLYNSSPIYNYADVMSAAGRLYWTSSSVTISDVINYFKSQSPLLPPQNYTMSIAPNNPNAAIVTGSLQGQIGPTPPSTEQALLNAAIANGIQLTPQQLASYVQISNAAGVLAANIANGTTQNPLITNSVTTPTNTALTAPTGFSATSSSPSSPGPINYSPNNSITWNSDSKASHYKVTLINITNSTTTVSSDVTTKNNFTFSNLLLNNNYAFVVTSCNAYGCGTSTVRYFQVKAPPTQTPSPSIPTNTTNSTTSSSTVNTNGCSSTTIPSPCINYANQNSIGSIDIYVRKNDKTPYQGMTIFFANNSLNNLFPQSTPSLLLKKTTDSTGKITLSISDFVGESAGPGIINARVYINGSSVNSLPINIYIDKQKTNTPIYLDGWVEAQNNGTSLVVSLIPAVGEGFDLFTLLAGRDPITGEILTSFDKTITIIGLASGIGSGKAARVSVHESLLLIQKELGTSIENVLMIAEKVASRDYPLNSVQDVLNLGSSLNPVQFLSKVRSELSIFLGKKLEENITKIIASKDSVYFSKLSTLLGISETTLKSYKPYSQVVVDLGQGFSMRTDDMLVKHISGDSFEVIINETKFSKNAPFTDNQHIFYQEYYTGQKIFPSKTPLQRADGTVSDKPQLTVKYYYSTEGEGIDNLNYTLIKY